MNLMRSVQWLAAGSAACLASMLLAPRAQACGGFFCDQSVPVNQAAERIIFANNSDGTVTAVIQIMYEGPAENFSWLLPIATVPGEGDIGIASDLAFERLQQATNPSYLLNTRVEGTCKQRDWGADDSAGPPGFDGGSGGSGGPLNGAPQDGGVTVEASGVVGAFEWTVISFDQSLPDAADAAVEWLTDNGYDVAEGSRGLIRPYLEDGLNLLALRLTKGSDAGSIRPISLTFGSELPMIPIKLTAVAANDDMGVLTWLLADARGIPQNYLALELNEARINWFNPGPTYDEVVTAAANEAGGQGFVTELAGPTSLLANVVWAAWDEQNWQEYSSAVYSTFQQMFDESFWRWGSWDGYWDAVRAAVTLPEELSIADFQSCPNCYSDQIEFSPSGFRQALEENVIEPMRGVQELLDAHAYITRLYTTMSAQDMTVDPLFNYNSDLPEVSNLHQADRIIECNPDIERFEAPWRIELPQGGVVRGTADEVGTWPASFAKQPANFRILRLSTSGSGVVVEDNRELIASDLSRHNERVPGTGSGASGSGGSDGGDGSTAGAGADADDDLEDGETSRKKGGCAVADQGLGAQSWSWAALLMLALVIRRRRTS